MHLMITSLLRGRSANRCRLIKKYKPLQQFGLPINDQLNAFAAEGNNGSVRLLFPIKFLKMKPLRLLIFAA
jgi:hypothetical protein